MPFVISRVWDLRFSARIDDRAGGGIQSTLCGVFSVKGPGSVGLLVIFEVFGLEE